MMRFSPHRWSQRRCIVGAAVVCALIAAGPASSASADVIELHDGRRFEGRIVGNFPEGVVIDAVVAGIQTRLPIWRSAVARIEYAPLPEGFFERAAADQRDDREPAADAAGAYLAVPIDGLIGYNTLPRGVELALRYAAKRGVRDVVFVIDSEGGSLAAARQIVQVIQRYGRDMHCRAVVRRALGEAAWIAFACESIHVTPQGELGGIEAADMAALGAGSDWPLSPPTQRESMLISAALRADVPPFVAEAMFSADAAIAAWRDVDGGVVTGPAAPPDVPADRVLFIDVPHRFLVLRQPTLVAMNLAQPIEPAQLRAADGDAAQALGPAMGVDPWHAVSPYGAYAIRRTAEQERRRREAERLSLDRTVAEHRSAADEVAQHWEAVQRYWALYEQWDPYGTTYGTHDHHVGRGSVTSGAGWIETRVTTLTPDARRAWRFRTYAAIDALLRVRRHLRKGIALDRRYTPDFEYSPPYVGDPDAPPAGTPLASTPELKIGEEVISPEGLYHHAGLLIDRLWRERNRIEP